MALVKNSKIAAGSGKVAAKAATRKEDVSSDSAPARGTRRAGGNGHEQGSSTHGRDQLSERLAAATEELASGLTEASAAAEELGRSMTQIASGAEEAAGAAQEQSTALTQVARNLALSRSQADASRRRVEGVELVLVEASAQIGNSVRAVERNAERQNASIEVIGELEIRARNIGEITATVAAVSDQTNLLALNAAIEAARAGDQGRGFAVVADEVRALAESAEKSAQEVQGLASAIQDSVRGIVDSVRAVSARATAEAAAGRELLDVFDGVRDEMRRIAESSLDTLTAAIEAERAAVEGERGSEQVASAAEQQSSAASQSQSAVTQQSQSLNQGQTAAQGLAMLAEQLRGNEAGSSFADDIAASAEELSATIQEMSGAAAQIMAALEQISRGAQQQESATQESSAALSQIEASARRAQGNAIAVSERVDLMSAALRDGQGLVERLLGGVRLTIASSRETLVSVGRLETVARNIEKFVDAIALIAVQTNMLAVSGAVEAARVGDAGRGFSVVSNDIRSLAREASESIDRVKETVRGVIDGVASLRRDLEQTILTTEGDMQGNRVIEDALEKVRSEVAGLGQDNNAILKSAEEILGAVVEAASGARQIATAASQASAAARQAAIASSQQATGAEDLAAAIEEIAALADELQRQNA